MAGITIGDLSPEFAWGSIVEGLDWRVLEDEAVRRQLRDVFEERGFLVFRGCEPSAKMQVAISRVFGPLKDHPTTTVARADKDLAQGLIDMYSAGREDDGDDRGKVLIGGRKLVRYCPWHFDHCYNDELNRAGVLRSPVIAPEGGRTGFIDGVEMYRLLSPELRQRIEGLNVIYTLDTRFTRMRFGRPEGFHAFPELEEWEKTIREAESFPRAMHPAVWQRSTGEKVLHVGAWMAVGIEGHEDAEGDELLDAVCQEYIARGHAYWHVWLPGDMVIWDNWRVVHAVEGVDPKYERHTQRTTIEGDYGLGYFEGGKKIGEVQREVL